MENSKELEPRLANEYSVRAVDDHVVNGQLSKAVAAVDPASAAEAWMRDYIEHDLKVGDLGSVEPIEVRVSDGSGVVWRYSVTVSLSFKTRRL
jgi:hypothetical protein